jgi:L-ribulokinase
VAGIDAHVGAVGAGIRPGRLVKILGTSACDLLVHPAAEPIADIPGISGIALGSILPDHHGLEAGQAAVGDLLAWFVREFGAPAGLTHEALTAEASRLRPGASGLLCLDWHHGNRNLLADPLLTGVVVGQTLRTRPAEVYRALIEATAFGARKIIERFTEHGVHVEEIVVCGGIAEKNPFFLQLYADILGRPIRRSRAGETCALGAAILGTAAAGQAAILEAERAMTGLKDGVANPDAAAAAVYGKLHALYGELHDAFGVPGNCRDLHHVMKELIAIRDAARRAD